MSIQTAGPATFDFLQSLCGCFVRVCTVSAYVTYQGGWRLEGYDLSGVILVREGEQKTFVPWTAIASVSAQC